jgi:Zn-dependent membrane protease YugP
MATLLLLLVVYGLQIGPHIVFVWATRRYGAERPDLMYTGRDLARLLLDENGLSDVPVENLPEGTPDFGDCYDPTRRVVQLSEKVADSKSIAAYAVAAHEVGHALQHARHDSSMELQHGLATLLRAATWVLIGGVLFLVIFSEPLGGSDQWHWLSVLIILFFVGSGVLLRFVTLPVEWNASFDYALPMLKLRHLLDPRDLKNARTLLFIAATTYIAVAVLGIISAIFIMVDW